MTYRPLLVTEWPLYLAAEFASRDVPMPNPALASVYAAFDDDNNLQAFIVCQLKLHAEPLCSYNPLAVSGLINFTYNSLVSQGFQDVECYIGTSNPDVRALVWHKGFHPAETMYVRRINGETTGRVK